MLVALGKEEIKTVEDFAGCAADDLVGWSERKDGETKRFEGTFKDFPVSREQMFESANRPTKGETFRERIEHHLDEYEASPKDEAATEKLVNQLAVVAETETHRTINEGGYEAAERYAKDHPGVTIYKTWETMMDDRVRDTHDYLEGSTVPMDARFYTFDGDSARYPGDFMLPENNINCRCVVEVIRG
jgi:hypothetical protein